MSGLKFTIVLIFLLLLIHPAKANSSQPPNAPGVQQDSSLVLMEKLSEGRLTPDEQKETARLIKTYEIGGGTWLVSSRRGFDLTLFGVLTMLAMLVCYALEQKSRWFILGFSFTCLLSSAYGFLQGSWPFGVLELIWAAVVFVKWRRTKPAKSL